MFFVDELQSVGRPRLAFAAVFIAAIEVLFASNTHAAEKVLHPPIGMKMQIDTSTDCSKFEDGKLNAGPRCEIAKHFLLKKENAALDKRMTELAKKQARAMQESKAADLLTSCLRKLLALKAAQPVRFANLERNPISLHRILRRRSSWRTLSA